MSRGVGDLVLGQGVDDDTFLAVLVAVHEHKILRQTHGILVRNVYIDTEHVIPAQWIKGLIDCGIVHKPARHRFNAHGWIYRLTAYGRKLLEEESVHMQAPDASLSPEPTFEKMKDSFKDYF